MALPCRATPASLSANWQSDSGQAGIEYLLALGAVAVGVAAAVLIGIQLLVPAVLKSLCDAVDPLGDGNCLTFL